MTQAESTDAPSEILGLVPNSNSFQLGDGSVDKAPAAKPELNWGVWCMMGGESL